MTAWLKDELQQIAETVDLHISPLRGDGGTTVPMIGTRARSATVKVTPRKVAE